MVWGVAVTYKYFANELDVLYIKIDVIKSSILLLVKGVLKVT